MKGFDFEVAVVGGGPAGNECARLLAAQGFDVCVLEKDSYVGETRQSTGGTFPAMMGSFGVDHENVMEKTSHVVYEGRDARLVTDFPGYVLDFGEFKRSRAEKAQKAGAKYLMDHMVQGVTEESLDEGPGKGVEISCYSNGEGKEIRAKIVVDASGASAVIGRQLGLVDSSSDRHGHGVEFEMEGADMEQEESMVLKFDHRYAPGGYAWIFDTGEGTAKVGVCAYSGYQELHEDESLGLEQRFERFVEEDPRLGEAEKIEKDGSFEKHMGSAFVDYMERKVEDNIILIGDTVSSLEPIAGQGIDNCMVSGREAAVAATHALETDKFCRENLSRYEERWEDQLGNKEDEVRAALIIYSLSDRTMESLLKSLEQFKEEKVHRLINDADMAVIAEILAKKPILLAYIFQDIFRARKLLWNLFRD